jgi:hypothetical protein
VRTFSRAVGWRDESVEDHVQGFGAVVLYAGIWNSCRPKYQFDFVALSPLHLGYGGVRDLGCSWDWQSGIIMTVTQWETVVYSFEAGRKREQHLQSRVRHNKASTCSDVSHWYSSLTLCAPWFVHITTYKDHWWRVSQMDYNPRISPRLSPFCLLRRKSVSSDSAKQPTQHEWRISGPQRRSSTTFNISVE